MEISGELRHWLVSMNQVKHFGVFTFKPSVTDGRVANFRIAQTHPESPMKSLPFAFALILAFAPPVFADSIPRFDGETRAGGETKHPERWRVEDGALRAGVAAAFRLEGVKDILRERIRACAADPAQQTGLSDALTDQQATDPLLYIATLCDDKADQAGLKPATFGRQVSASGVRHSFLLTGPKTVLVGEDSTILWETGESSRDGYVLPSGNLLVAHATSAREYTRDGKVVWEYRLAPENGELETAVRLDAERTLVVELGPKPRVLEVGPKGEILAETPLQPETENTHMQTRMVRKLPNGNYLAPHLLAFAVKEYTPAGKVVRVIRTDLGELGGRAAENWPFTAIALANGNILVNLTHGNKTVEFDPEGKVAWQVDNTTHPGLFADPCGAQRLPNGNTIVCSYGQRDASKPRIFEVTPDKKVVWEYFHDATGAHEVHVITTNGHPVPGTPLR